jgi:hypothetical protein
MKQTKSFLTVVTTAAFFTAIILCSCNSSEAKKEAPADSLSATPTPTTPASTATPPDTLTHKKDSGDKGGQTVPGDQNPKPPKN